MLVVIFGLHFIFVSLFCCCSLFVVFLHFISRLLYHVTGTPPWLFRPVKSSTSSDLCPDYFWLHFRFHLLQGLWFWVGIFYPQALFTLRSFTDILACVYQGFPGSWKFFLEVCRATYWSSEHRPGLSVCLIHSNPQSLIYLKFVFIHVNIAKVLFAVKTLIKKY